MKKKLLCLLLALLLVLPLAACGDDPDATDRHLDIDVESGTWSIYWYLCGSDLETNYGCATQDLMELMEVTLPENVRVVIQTGGAKEWQNNVVNADILQRYVYDSTGLTLVDELPPASMGDTATLTDFLRFCKTYYPAEHTAVLFWNHGGGSVNGAAFDERYYLDSLTLDEMRTAFGRVWPGDENNPPLELVGFDTCLMATVDVVDTFVGTARYLVASEEVEPGNGWNYTGWAGALAEDPTMDGAALGRIICDTYYAGCEAVGTQNKATLSLTDLTRCGPLLEAYEAFGAEALAEACEDPSFFSRFARIAAQSENYGGNTREQGYTNMVDAGCILKNSKSLLPGAADALAALEECVIYQRNGERRQDASGLATYYPLCIQGSEELSVFRNVCISPWYLSFVDKIAYGADHEGMLDGYQKDLWLGEDSLFWSQDALESAAWSWDYWNREQGTSIGLSGEDGEISVQYEVAPYMDEDGNYVFQLSEETLWETDSIYNCLYMILDDGRILDFGADDDVYVDWDTGEVYDGFDGYWFALPDGQPLAAYLAEADYDYNIYTAPITLNGVDTNLRIRQDYGADSCTTSILGVWDGIDAESGQAARTIRPLKKGDQIVPRYTAYDTDTWEESTFVGSDYVYDGDPALEEYILPDGDYYYGFCINDIYGGETYTDYVVYNVEGEEVYYYE